MRPGSRSNAWSEQSAAVGTYPGALAAVKVDKTSVPFGADLGGAVRSAARRAGVELSPWLAQARRVGPHRILYEIDDGAAVVGVVRVAGRADAYRR